jgi:YVTN family beta-propeller protein
MFDSKFSVAARAAAIGAGAFVHALCAPVAAQVCAYVTHDADGMISVINTEAKVVVATIQAAGIPTDVAVLPSGAFAYVTNTDPDTVSVIDTVGKAITKTIDIPECTAPLCGPESIAITPDGQVAYVPSPVDSGAQVLSVIDTATNTAGNPITVRADAVPRGGGVGVASVGSVGCVSGYTIDAQSDVLMYLDVLNTATNGLTRRNLTLGPVGDMQAFLERAHTIVAVTSAGLCYVTNAFTTGTFMGSLLRVPTATNNIAPIALVSMPPIPMTTGVAITPDDHFAYVSGGTGGTPPAVDKGFIFVIDTTTTTNPVVSAIQLGGHFFTDVALSPDGTFALVTDRDGDRVFVIDTATKTVTGTITVPARSKSVAIANVPNGCALVSSCVGDCDNVGRVTVTQILKMVNIALGTIQISECLAGDAAPPDGRITVSDIIKAVNNVLNECPAA